MIYNFSNIATILNGQIMVQQNNLAITEISIDTRKILNPYHSLFFAIKGIRNNGNQFIEDAYNKGIRNFIVSEIVDFKRFSGCSVLLVDDSLHALQHLVAHHRNLFKIPIIGITGSNGKTIIKEWLYQLLSPEKNIIRSPKSFNSQVGVPLSVWNIDDSHQLGIFEAGISKLGEMKKLEAIIKPSIGVFTNIGPAHAAGFESDLAKAKEKAVLFSSAKKIIFCKDYEIIAKALESQTNTFTWGKNSNADIRIIKSEKTGRKTSLIVEYQQKSQTISVPFSDEASIENALHCVATMLLLDYNFTQINERLALLKNVPMRLELKYGINDCVIIDDSYSADFLSLKIALDFYNQQEGKKKRTLIISEFEDSGLSAENFCEKLNVLLQEYKIQKLIGVGGIFFTHKSYIDTSELVFSAYHTTESFINEVENLTFDRELVLLKGARSFHFEKISSYLQGQSHRTILEVNLNALVHNLNVYKSYLPKQTGIIAMVKAYSYGSGSVEVAHLLQSEKVDYLAVAYLDEGIKLRKSGVSMPIMVLNPDVGEFPQMAHYNLEPEIYSIKQFEQLEHFLLHHNSAFKVHLKIETGMNRLGLVEAELLLVLEKIIASKNLIIGSVFSHLAASDAPEHDDYTRKQISIFETLSQIVLDKFSYSISRHISNSSGIIRFPEAAFDFVRLGIGLYGIDSAETIQRKLQTTGTLKTRISQLKNISAGNTVGYNRKGIVDTDKTIAVLAIGYADGYDRRFSNGVGKTFVRGQYANTIGNVCMDMTMIDVSHIDDIAEGDEVEIYGSNVSIIEMAQNIDTIPYELLTHISARVKRVYFWD
jgi:alanine racemase